MIFWYKYQNKLDSNTKKHGVYCLAIIIEESATKLGGRSFTYEFSYLNKTYEYEPFVSKSFFKKHKIGDTIIVKILKSELPHSLVCENIKYKRCFGDQPQYGWKKLPKCK